jgi:hypothetical protein
VNPQLTLDTIQPGERICLQPGVYDDGLVFNRTLVGFATLACEPGAVLRNTSLSDASGHVLRADPAAAFLRVEGCLFDRAVVTSGGALDLYGDDLEFVGNEVTGSNDNAIYTDEASSRIRFLRNWLHHNGASDVNQDHGIYLQGDDHWVESNLIHDQGHGFGIQVYDDGDRAVIVHNTITHNGHLRGCCGGIVAGGGGGVSGVVIRNNVIAFNRNTSISCDSTRPTSSVAERNVVWPQNFTGCTGMGVGSGNVFANPLFVDEPGRNLRLATGSPGIDAALAGWVTTTAFDGVIRPQGAVSDIGAYER